MQKLSLFLSMSGKWIRFSVGMFCVSYLGNLQYVSHVCVCVRAHTHTPIHVEAWDFRVSPKGLVNFLFLGLIVDFNL
jgi:hypothetical protein